MNTRTSVLAIASVLTTAAGAAAAACLGARPAVIELYTSQGCNSCPPADALLGELARRPEVLALAFHVDYWDDLGWKDRFDLPVAVQRQSNYARALKLASMYTPQMVIDGQADVLGSDRERVEQLLHQPRTGVPVHIAVQGDELVVGLDDVANSPASEVQLVSYLRAAETAIGRGENSGRLLREFNIVRSLTTLGKWRGTAAQWRVKLTSLPADAHDVAVLVQEPLSGAMAGAASLALP